MARLAGKTALVTGAARGIGAAIARRFTEEGARVVVNDLDPEAAGKIAAEIGGIGLAADVSDGAAVARMFRQARESLESLDILVNNAGISGAENDPESIARLAAVGQQQVADGLAGNEPSVHFDAILDVGDEEWRRLLAIHLDGTFYCTREALRWMIETGTRGSVINMGSIMGTSGGAMAPAYCAAKAGILGLTRSLARDLASRRIRVNAIAPGWIESDMTAPLAAIHPMLRAQTPLGRLGDVDDVAWAAVYLASEEARFVTGQVLSPNGGWTMSQ
ncbi:MAG: SDR family NAD(P)-dependent oxidoreductase [Myxococcota bacterium]